MGEVTRPGQGQRWRALVARCGTPPLGSFVQLKPISINPVLLQLVGLECSTSSGRAVVLS